MPLSRGSTYDAAKKRPRGQSREEWERRRNRIAELRKQFPENDSRRIEDLATASAKAERELHREQWAGHQFPELLLGQATHLQARELVSAAERIAKLIRVLSKEPCLTGTTQEAVKAAFDELRRDLPHLLGVRDSAEHVEDRARGKVRKNPIPIVVAPDPKGYFPSGIVLRSEINFGEDTLRMTMENGFIGEMKITLATVSRLRDAIQACINALPWKGLPRHWPFPS